jgi:hypothetical protein
MTTDDWDNWMAMMTPEELATAAIRRRDRKAALRERLGGRTVADPPIEALLRELMADRAAQPTL